jgi:hypothetical protein
VRLFVAAFAHGELHLKAPPLLVGSFNSVKALPISMPAAKISKRSVIVGSSAFCLASGDTSTGYS